MNTRQLYTLPIGSILKRLTQHSQFCFCKVHNTVFMSINIPLAIIIFDTSTDAMSIMHETSVNSAWMEKIVYAQEIYALLFASIYLFSIFCMMVNFCK